jgi:hypothetical protein
MTNRSNSQDQLARLLFIVLVMAFLLWVYARRLLEAWWGVYGVWLGISGVSVLALGLMFIAYSRRLKGNLRKKDVKTVVNKTDNTVADSAVAKGMRENGGTELLDGSQRRNVLFREVIAAIMSFKPSRSYNNEFEYQLELQGWLKSRFPYSKIEVQSGSSRPDIVIGDIAIEVKGPTDDKALNTLTTKCLKYTQYYEKVIIVLFEPSFSEANYDEIKRGLEERFPEVHIIRKD